MKEPILEELKFGTGSFIGHINKHYKEFFKLPIQEQARRLGWYNGCPVVDELTSPSSKRGGAEKMTPRYAEVNFWFGFISRAIEASKNDAMFKEFSETVERKEGESPVKYEEQSVPKNYKERLAPLNKLPGFSLPRMLIAYLELDFEKDTKTNQQQLIKGLQILEDAIKESKTSAELMARAAEGFVKGGKEVSEITRHMLGQGWVDEQHAYSMLEECKKALQEFAPTIWKYYEGLTPEERKEKCFIK